MDPDSSPSGWQRLLSTLRPISALTMPAWARVLAALLLCVPLWLLVHWAVEMP